MARAVCCRCIGAFSSFNDAGRQVISFFAFGGPACWAARANSDDNAGGSCVGGGARHSAPRIPTFLAPWVFLCLYVEFRGPSGCPCVCLVRGRRCGNGQDHKLKALAALRQGPSTPIAPVKAPAASPSRGWKIYSRQGLPTPVALVKAPAVSFLCRSKHRSRAARSYPALCA
jgi:hypothetical protein